MVLALLQPSLPLPCVIRSSCCELLLNWIGDVNHEFFTTMGLEQKCLLGNKFCLKAWQLLQLSSYIGVLGGVLPVQVCSTVETKLSYSIHFLSSLKTSPKYWQIVLDSNTSIWIHGYNMCLVSWLWWWIQGWLYDPDWSSHRNSQVFDGNPGPLDSFLYLCRKPGAMRETILQTQLLELQRIETSVLKRWWLWSQEATPEICPQPGLPCCMRWWTLSCSP